jgi:hypothetical protein
MSVSPGRSATVGKAIPCHSGGDASEHAQRLVLATAAHVRHQAVSDQRRVRAHGQRAWPALGWDLMACADALHPWLPAGFYYKAFKSPAWAWPWFERALRHAAGLGRRADLVTLSRGQGSRKCYAASARR